ncbi:unnamed protein product, partial [Prorocentrum cordatum]
ACATLLSLTSRRRGRGRRAGARAARAAQQGGCVDVEDSWTAGLEAIEAPPVLQLWLEMLDPDLLELISRVEGCGHRAWIVGGAVRDVLRGIAPSDVDIATTMRPSELLEAFPRSISTGERWGVITVRHGGVTCECSVLRAAVGGCLDGRRSSELVPASSLREDLAARDFTINAMAVDAGRGLLYDPFGGLQDSEAGTLRAVSDPASLMLRADALRALRAYRFLGRPAGEGRPRRLDPALRAALVEAAPLLQGISCERILKELKLILQSPGAPDVVRTMIEDGSLQAALPLPAPLAAEGRELRALGGLWRDEATLRTLRRLRPGTLPAARLADPLAEGASPTPPAREQPFAFYAVLDLEATCWERGAAPDGFEAEVRRLPAVLVDGRAGRAVAEFRTFVKPELWPQLSSYCTRLTGISQALGRRVR